MAEAKLYYFDGRGLGEKVRIMLCAGGIQFEHILLTERAEMEKLLEEGSLLFNQLPLLEIDGLKLVQGNAMARYVARRSGLYSDDPKIQARLDMLYDGTRDFLMPFLMPFMGMTEEEVKQKVQEVSLPKFMPVYEKILKESGTGYLVGDKVSFADVGLLEVLLSVEDYIGEEAFEDYPLISEFFAKMKSLDCIKVYLEKYRKRKNDERYKTEVLKVLGWEKFPFGF